MSYFWYLKAKCFGFGYKITRRIFITVHSVLCKISKKPYDLESTIELGDKSLHGLDAVAGSFLFYFPQPPSPKTHVHTLSFSSPLVVSSFKDDLTILNIWNRMGIGGITLKTLLKAPRTGNPKPRICEVKTPEGMGLINAMGLPGKGLEKGLAQLLEHPLKNTKKPLGFSIGGNSPQDYIDTIKTLLSITSTWSLAQPYIELNISCPNTPEGQDLSKNPNLLHEVLNTVQTFCSWVISIKLSPDQSNDSLKQYAAIIKSHPNCFINIGNTQYKRCDQIGLPAHILALPGGGYSGPALFKRTLEMTQLLNSYGVPLMATGGISTADQVNQLQKSGAVLFGLATILVQNPYKISEIHQGLVY